MRNDFILHLPPLHREHPTLANILVFAKFFTPPSPLVKQGCFILGGEIRGQGRKGERGFFIIINP
ncbi:MAG TPA: hypothetical protein DDW56_08790 [Cyanobacteria bacterium UBA11366]|nr:hypothetical protein [Cyanobacteria bacterium UBA11366]HBS69159.1 hypothetical protein [Cyanobacteria bacterium UBA11153]HCA93786.1 hypothetical protein [Cyanobacteria bacterium UBA9226]